MTYRWAEGSNPRLCLATQGHEKLSTAAVKRGPSEGARSESKKAPHALASHLRDREHRELMEPPLPLLAILRPRIPPGSDRHLDSCDPLYIGAEIAQPRGNQPKRSS